MAAYSYDIAKFFVGFGNALTQSATPLTTIAAPGRAARLRAVDPLVRTWQPDLLVVGEPSHADGSPHPTARAARQFAKAIGSRFARPCLMIDERLSSHEAATRLAQSDRATRALGLDAMAAAVIAESYLRAPDAAVQP